MRGGRRASFFSPANESFDRTRAGHHLHAGEQLAKRALHRLRTDEQRLLEPTPVEDAVGEDVAAVEVGCELNLVDRDEREVEVARHRLDGADPVARLARLDLLLAGDQCDRLDADLLDDAVVDLARQQAQRQADHARAMREHPLDREMRLAGIGRPQHEGHAGRAVARMGGAGGGIMEVHRESRRAFGENRSSGLGPIVKSGRGRSSATSRRERRSFVSHRYGARGESSAFEHPRNEPGPNRYPRRNQGLFLQAVDGQRVE